MVYSLVPNANNTVGSDLTAMYDNFVALESAQIVDSGSTADGDYWRFEDGLQICTNFINDFLLETNDLKGGIYRSSVIAWNFPMAFNSQSEIYFNVNFSTTSSGQWVGVSYPKSNTEGTWQGYSNQSASQNQGSVVYFAIGRWK